MKRMYTLLFLTFAMALALLPMQAHASDSGTCGENVTWTLDDSNVLTIRGTGEMTSYSSSQEVPWSTKRSSVTRIVIENGVTSIGDNAFIYCINVTEATIPDTVSSIGKYAFSRCSKLGSLRIPDGVKSIGKGLAEGDENMEEIILPSSVTAMDTSGLCGECTKLTSVVLPNGVTTVGYHCFSDCSSLTSVTLPSSVTEIANNAFQYSKNLTDIYYQGTQEQWNAVTINTSNDSSFNDATVHFAPSLTLDASYDRTTKEVTVILKAAETLTLSNYDAEIAWDTTQFTLTDITNGQTSAFSEFEANTNGESADVGKFAAVTDSSNVQIAADSILATCVFAASEDEIPAGTYPFTLTVTNAADENGSLLPWSGKTLSDEIVIEDLTLSSESFENSTKGKASITFTEPAAGDFTVSCAAPCVVIYSSGTSDQQLTATAVETAQNTYSFTLPDNYQKSGKLIVRLKCDFTGDGEINSTDALQTLRVSNMLRSADQVQLLTSDMNNDGKLTSTDAYQILKLAVGLISATW